MRTPEHATAETPHAVPWQDVEELLHEIGELARSRRAVDEFADTVCRQARQTLAAEVVAIWLRDQHGAWRLSAESASQPGIQNRLAPGETIATQNSLVAPFAIGAGREGAVEVLLATDHRARTNQLPTNVVEAIAELVGDFYRKHRIEELRDGDSQWRQFGEMAARVHASLDLDTTVYRIANEGRTWLTADRVCVLIGERSKARLAAMSGVDRVDRRADLVRTMEALAGGVASSGEALWFEGKTTSLAPEIEDRLHQFLEHSPAKTLAVVPLDDPMISRETLHRPLAAILVVEHFEQLPSLAPLRERLQVLAPHAASAIANARRHAQIPWAGLFDRLATVDRHWLWTRTGMIAAAVIAAAALLAFVPADFKIEARGELRPQTRREFFAPTDGVIGKVEVSHGDKVLLDEVLLTLTDSQLDLETARVNGELQTARKKLAATRALQHESERPREDSVERRHQLTADEEELKELIKSLEKQQQILEARHEELTVRTPLAGAVLTWNVEPLLSARPVARGQHLMTVADLAGPWELELQVPDDRMGHVLATKRDQNVPLDVSFVVATDPDHVYRTQIDKIAQAAETDEQNRPTVTVTATVAADALPSKRPGAEVIAHIHCGRRSVGYVWFHDLVDAVRSWLWF